MTWWLRWTITNKKLGGQKSLPDFAAGLPVGTVSRLLTPFVTEPRISNMREVLTARTESVVLILDGVHDPHNLSAVLRSADAMGFQRVLAVVPKHGFKAAGGIALGSQKWVDVELFDSPESCLKQLQKETMAIFVTALGQGAKEPRELELSGPTALVLGNEHAGVSPAFKEAARGNVLLPMVGFVESFNISVAAALCMSHLLGARKDQWGQVGNLSIDRQQELLDLWVYRGLKKSDQLLSEALRREQQAPELA